MTSRIATYCFLASLNPAIVAGQPATGSGHERLSLEAAIRIAIENGMARLRGGTGRYP